MIVVDSMQVYAGLERISNQARARPAGLVSIVPVTERWTAARHAEAAEALVSRSGAGAVFDAGTGMYLNAALMDIPMAPEVPRPVREEAIRASSAEANPRRASRALELELAGAAPRGSIWDARLRRETTLLYLRPDREALDGRIATRSARIAAEGVAEARTIRSLQKEGHDVNPSVTEAVGVRELLAVVEGEITPGEAEERISARTRRLARRQMRWFDKLARTLSGVASVFVARTPGELQELHNMHDTIWR